MPNKERILLVVGVVVVLLAFAGNSLLTRAALVRDAISVPGFVLTRVLSAAVALSCLTLWRGGQPWPRRSDASGAFALATYAVTFTFAYVQLGAAVGALILFASVQVTMVAAAWYRGQRPSALQAAGLATATVGLVVVLSPGLLQPTGGARVLGIFAWIGMVVAGVAWGAYTLSGRQGGDPLARSARNFNAAALLSLVVLPWVAPSTCTAKGVVLAVSSGVVTSGFGYAIWYQVLPRLSVPTAAVVQLLVPAVAAVGGVLFLNESMTMSQVLGTAVILGGIWLTLPGRN